jgi:hypothetical protein
MTHTPGTHLTVSTLLRIWRLGSESLPARTISPAQRLGLLRRCAGRPICTRGVPYEVDLYTKEERR